MRLHVALAHVLKQLLHEYQVPAKVMQTGELGRAAVESERLRCLQLEQLSKAEGTTSAQGLPVLAVESQNVEVPTSSHRPSRPKPCPFLVANTDAI